MICIGTLIAWSCESYNHRLEGSADRWKTGLYRFGRRPLYIWGLGGMSLAFLVMGVFGVIPESDKTAIGIGAIMVIITLFFGLTVAPVCKSCLCFHVFFQGTDIRQATVSWPRFPLHQYDHNRLSQVEQRISSPKSLPVNSTHDSSLHLPMDGESKPKQDGFSSPSTFY
jgi:hypothetical protein